MKRVFTGLCIAAFAIGALSSVSLAGPQPNAKILIHLASKTTKNDCTWAATKPTCAQVVTHGTLYPQVYYAYVLITDGDAIAGIAGMQFGINYNGASGAGVDIWGWKLCGTLEFQQPSPVWPAAGGGNMITWDWTNACQRFEPGGAGTGVVANAGYFYCGSYGNDILAVTPRPVDGYAKVASCAAEEDIIEGPGDGTSLNPPVVRTPSHLGTCGFGTSQGYNPCGMQTPIENTTWSNVKSLYSR